MRCHGRFITDCNPYIISTFWQQQFRRLCITLLYSTAHYLQTDRQSQKAHRVIEQILRDYILQCPLEQQASQLAFVRINLNAHLFSSKWYSTNYLNYALYLCEPLDIVAGLGSGMSTAIKVAHMVQKHLSLSQQCMAHAQAQQKTHYDQHQYTCELLVGKQVLLSTIHFPLPSGRKLGQCWMGPIYIKTKVGNVACRLVLPAQMATHPVFHISILRPYDASGGLHHQLPLVSGKQEFKVASILHHRRWGQGLQYLVEWAGYDLANTT